MRKLIIGTLLLLLPIICFGQLVKTSMTYAQPVAAGSSYTDEYQALLTIWATDPVGDTLTYQNTLIDSLLTYPVGDVFWDRAEILYVAANNNEDNAKVNWLNPGTFDITDPGGTEPTFTRYQGWTGDGSTDYLSTNWDISDSVNVGRFNLSAGVYLRIEQESDGWIYGWNSSPGSDLLYRPHDVANGGWGNSRINATTDQLDTDAATSQGFFINTRRSNTDIEMYRNGSTLDSESDVTSATASSDCYLLAYRLDNGTSGGHSSNQIAIFFIIDGITDAEALQLNRFFETYMEAIGSEVQ